MILTKESRDHYDGGTKDFLRDALETIDALAEALEWAMKPREDMCDCGIWYLDWERPEFVHDNKDCKYAAARDLLRKVTGEER